MPGKAPRATGFALGEPPKDSIGYTFDWLTTERGFEGGHFNCLGIIHGMDFCPVCGLWKRANERENCSSWPQIRGVSYFDSSVGETECVMSYCKRCKTVLARWRCVLEDAPHDPGERRLKQAPAYYNIPGRLDESDSLPAPG